MTSAPFDVSGLKHYPALTVGLPLFTLVLLLVDSNQWLSSKFALYPGAPFKLDLNRISFYLLFHNSFVHWLFNSVALFTPMCLFERKNGTVYTGITLNLLAVVAALQYCVVGYLLFPETYVIGLSGVVFSFWAYYAVKEHQHRASHSYTVVGRTITIPTLYVPVILLVVTTVLFPVSSFWGHVAGLSAGYLMGHDYLNVLYPPSKFVLWIEDKLAGPISKLDGLVTYHKEDQAIESRGVTYSSFLYQDIEAAVSEIQSAAPARPAPFQGSGNVLGA